MPSILADAAALSKQRHHTAKECVHVSLRGTCSASSKTHLFLVKNNRDAGILFSLLLNGNAFGTEHAVTHSEPYT